jgi:hypothetical protein
LPRLPFIVASHPSLAHFLSNIRTHCGQIHSALSNSSKCGQVPKDCTKSATAVSLRRGPSCSCFQWFCPRIMDPCFFSSYSATHTFFHLLKALISMLGCWILLANCFKVNSVSFMLIVALPSAPPGPMNSRTDNLHRIRHRKSQVMWGIPQSLLHSSSAVPQPADIIVFGG